MNADKRLREAAKDMFLRIHNSCRPVDTIGGQVAGNEIYRSTFHYNGFSLSEWENALREAGIILD